MMPIQTLDEAEKVQLQNALRVIRSAAEAEGYDGRGEAIAYALRHTERNPEQAEIVRDAIAALKRWGDRARAEAAL